MRLIQPTQIVNIANRGKTVLPTLENIKINPDFDLQVINARCGYFFSKHPTNTLHGYIQPVINNCVCVYRYIVFYDTLKLESFEQLSRQCTECYYNCPAARRNGLVKHLVKSTI